MTSDDKEKANILAKFFSSVYKKEPHWTWEMNKDEKPEINHDFRLEITKDVNNKKVK